jgi:single-strand DNA-binding protein
MSVNKVILVGNLGRDPEVRYAKSGKKIVSFSLATSEKWKNGERTEWHKVVIFNEKIADLTEKFLKVGSKIYLEGQLQTQKWDDKLGNTRSTTQVVVAYNGILQMLDSREVGLQRPVVTSDAPKPQAEPPSAAVGNFDDEIPF